MNQERKGTLTKEEEPGISEYKPGLTLYVLPTGGLGQEVHDVLWENISLEVRDTPVELQYEFRYKDGLYMSLPRILKTANIINVHAPINDIDLASSDQDVRRKSVVTTKKSLDLAHFLGTGLIIHPSSFPSTDPQQQRIHSRQSFIEIAGYKSGMGYNTPLNLENLEGRLPSGREEFARELEHARHYDPEVGACVDIAHMWHNFILDPNSNSSDFEEELLSYFNMIRAAAPIRTVHLGGAYIDKSNGNEIHETHAVPGVLNGYSFETGEDVHFDEPPNGFTGEWMEINSALRAIDKSFSGDENKPHITLEIHNRSIQEQIIATQLIEKRLKKISAERKNE